MFGMAANDLENILRALEIISVIAGGGAIVWRMANMATRFELIGVQQSKEINELKKGIESLSSVLVTLAQQSGRIDRIEDRQMAEGKRVDDIGNRLNIYLNGKLGATA